MLIEAWNHVSFSVGAGDGTGLLFVSSVGDAISGDNQFPNAESYVISYSSGHGKELIHSRHVLYNLSYSVSNFWEDCP